MNRISSLTALALACLTITACAGLSPRADSSRFFTLAPLAEAEAKTESPAGTEQLSLGIGPVKFPVYLDREELVTRITQNRFEVSENNRWIEPLEENFTRVLSQNLSALLHTDRIVRYPWQNSQRPGYQVELEVLRFEPNVAQDVQLSARWSVIDGSDKKILSVKDSRLTRRATAKSTEASAAALSAVLGDFSREIAETVRAIADQRKP